MNIGAGRVIVQDLTRIDAAIADGSFAEIRALADFIAALKRSGGTAHVMGLISPGGVHSDQNQIAALARHVASAGVPVLAHAFLDGRDTPPSSAADYLRAFEADTKTAGVRIATVSGRYYAMDRDNRWERVEKAYRALALGEGEIAPDAETAVSRSYADKVTDEFVPPTVIGDYAGMTDGDGIVMANFRADRAREILRALVLPGFDGFDRAPIEFAARLGLTEYADDLNKHLAALFPKNEPSQVLGEIVAAHGMTQLRIAETEKYAHVTYFLNGGREDVFEGEERILVPSPKVATYDLQPEMSAPEVTDKLVAAIESGKFDLIVVNFANGDMVGHSGIFEAAVKAAEAVDAALGRLAEAVTAAGGTLLITADHGNVEQMRDPVTGEPHTAHTTLPVPVILVNPPPGVASIGDGALSDIAPTLLGLLGLAVPGVMTGHSLIAGASVRRAAV
jgi:2,3-bisphosphoglycerate-independent phosphoglycerate mutase